MRKTKIFKSGNSMAIRLPKDFNIQGNKDNEVEIFKENNSIIIREIPQNLSKVFFLLQTLPDDFFSNDRCDSIPQKRELI